MSDKKRPLLLYGKCDSKEGKILIQFELGDVSSVWVPFDLLVSDKLIENMIPQGFFHQFASFRILNRIVQVSRQRLDSMFLSSHDLVRTKKGVKTH